MHFSVTTPIKEFSFSDLSRPQRIAITNVCEKSFNFKLSIDTWCHLLIHDIGRAVLCFSSRKCKARQLIGFALTTRVLNIQRIDLLAVLPSWHQSGVGTAMMSYLFKRSLQDSCLIRLNYDASQWKLCQFYASFRPIRSDTALIKNVFSPQWFSTTPVFDPKTSLEALKQKKCSLANPQATRQARHIWYIKRLEIVLQLGIVTLVGLVLPALLAMSSEAPGSEEI